MRRTRRVSEALQKSAEAARPLGVTLAVEPMEIGFPVRDRNPDRLTRQAWEYMTSILDEENSRLAPGREAPQPFLTA